MSAANNLHEQFTHAFGVLPPPRPTYLAPPPGIAPAYYHHPPPTLAAGGEDAGFWKWVSIALIALVVGGVTLYVYLQPTKPPPSVNEVLATVPRRPAAAPPMEAAVVEEAFEEEVVVEDVLPADLQNDRNFTSLAELMR